ncbi:MAG TPA: diadenylate cyclase CdaA [Pseudogracilibacillus sp.]|nr:diadenylate cyclase CdaA [Pseudogracilibacillus sp.]
MVVKGSVAVLSDIDFIKFLAIGVDIALVWFVFYKLIMIIRGTKAIQLLKGIIIVIVVWFISAILNLPTIQWIMNQVISWGFLAIIILFQPELRRALEQLGRGGLFTRSTKSEEDVIEETAQSIITSCVYMAKRRIGALITIELETGIGEYAETGIPINGKLTNQLLTNIFTPNTPLHDGAVILKDETIVAAACYLPLSEDPDISKDLGTRHRAAMGISEVTDALTIIVSEETGAISCTKNGELYRSVDDEQLYNILKSSLTLSVKSSDSNFFNLRGKK